MAHKGKFYKVHKRRDFSNVSNYREAAPEAYVLAEYGRIESTFFNIPPIVDTLAYNTRTLEDPVMQWTSDEPTDPGVTCRWRLIFPDEEHGIQNKFRFQLLVRFDFRIFDVILGPNGSIQPGNISVVHPTAELIYKDSRIDYDPLNGGWNISPAPWSRYNP